MTYEEARDYYILLKVANTLIEFHQGESEWKDSSNGITVTYEVK